MNEGLLKLLERRFEPYEAYALWRDIHDKFPQLNHQSRIAETDQYMIHLANLGKMPILPLIERERRIKPSVHAAIYRWVGTKLCWNKLYDRGCYWRYPPRLKYDPIHDETLQLERVGITRDRPGVDLEGNPRLWYDTRTLGVAYHAASDTLYVRF